MKTINQICNEYTACKTVAELANQKGNYRPSLRNLTGLSKDHKINEIERLELGKLVKAYNLYQEKRGDNRRASEG